MLKPWEGEAVEPTSDVDVSSRDLDLAARKTAGRSGASVVGASTESYGGGAPRCINDDELTTTQKAMRASQQPPRENEPQPSQQADHPKEGGEEGEAHADRLLRRHR
jgi:hypothetical protein